MILSTMNKNRSLESFLEYHAQGKIRPGFSNYYYKINVNIFDVMIPINLPTFICNPKIDFDGSMIIATQSDNLWVVIPNIACLPWNRNKVLKIIEKLVETNNNILQTKKATREELEKIYNKNNGRTWRP